MTVPIRILLAEDSDDDAAIVVHALRRSGYEPITTRVYDRAGYLDALDLELDAIVSDYAMPQFSSAAALALMKARGLDLPFIVVSERIEEDGAVGILRAGAHDFVTKENLRRLGPALDRELVDARQRSEQRKSERSVQRQLDFLRMVLDAHPSLVFVKDSNGRFSMANRAVAELYGTTVDDLIGKSEADLNRRIEEVMHTRAVEHQVLTTAAPAFIAAEQVTDPRTGETRWFEVCRMPLTLPDRRDPHVLGVAAEITERKAAEDALRFSEDQARQAQKMEAVGQLAGGMAHDFNNLLTAILGYTALLLDVARDQPDLTADLQEIKNAGERAGALTRQLLTLSKKQVVEPAILDLNDMVGELEHALSRVAGDDIRLETIKAPALGHVKADPNQIEQVLLNLAANARDAMPRGGVLRIETTNETMTADPRQPASGSRWPCVTLRVSDSGSGIAPEIIDRVFEPFFTTKGPGKGSGLGLSIVYGIVTQSGGVISVESERNSGTSFSIRFPAVDGPVSARKSAEQTAMPHAGTETILLVEDEPGVRHLVQRVLSVRGYDVLQTRDVAHAAEISARYPGQIHLLLSDIVMPGLNGPDLAQRIIAQRPDIRVLYMSGFTNQLNTEHGELSPCVTILHKPFTPESLVRTVRDCLDVAVS